jgi:RimJ/RimL family protein N-acetyltransferase
MRLVTDIAGEPPVIWEWMSKQTQIPWSSDLRTIGALRDDGTIAAAVAFNGWTPAACFIHVVLDSAHSLSKQFLRAVMSYPFDTVGVRAIYGLTPRDLDRAIRFNEKIGFKKIAETVDCVLLELRREACRFLKETLQ